MRAAADYSHNKPAADILRILSLVSLRLYSNSIFAAGALCRGCPAHQEDIPDG